MKSHRNLFRTLFVSSLLFLGGCVSYKFEPINLSKLSNVDICYQLAYNINKLSFKSREALFKELIQRNKNCVDLAELIIEKRNNYLSKEGYPNGYFPESGEASSMPSDVREINVTNMAGSHGNK